MPPGLCEVRTSKIDDEKGNESHKGIFLVHTPSVAIVVRAARVWWWRWRTCVNEASWFLFCALLKKDSICVSIRFVSTVVPTSSSNLACVIEIFCFPTGRSPQLDQVLILLLHVVTAVHATLQPHMHGTLVARHVQKCVDKPEACGREQIRGNVRLTVYRGILNIIHASGCRVLQAKHMTGHGFHWAFPPPPHT